MATYNRYGKTAEEAAAHSRALVDHTGWSRRPVVDGEMTLGEWSERERRREQHRGDATTGAEVMAAWDAQYPRRAPVDSKLHFGREAPRDKSAKRERAQEIGRPTRIAEV
jgi:hypothetical protein